MATKLPIFNYSFNQPQNSGIVEFFIDGQIIDADTEAWIKQYNENSPSVSYKSFRESIESHISNGITHFKGYINSVGGNVIEANAIYDYLVDIQSKGIKVELEGRGIVASSATKILMADKSRTLSENSWYMIHNVSGGVWGDVNEVEAYAKTLRKFNNEIKIMYASETSLAENEVEDMMNKETWMTAKEAAKHGFVKSVTESKSFNNKINPSNWIYGNTEVLQAYNLSTKTEQEMNFDKITQTIKDEFNNLVEALGIKKPDNATQAFESFTSSIVNSIKESVPATESIQEIVNNAVTEALKGKEANETTEKIINSLKEEIEGLKQHIVNNTGGAKPDDTTKPAGKFDHEGAAFL